MFKEVEQKISQLVKVLSAREAEARTLRLKLDALEYAALKPIRTLEKSGTGPGVPVPEGILKELFDARNALKEASERNTALRRERNKIGDLVAANGADVHRLSTELKRLETDACWKPGARIGYVDPKTIHDETNDWKNQVTALKSERDTLQKEFEIHNDEIDSLLRKLQELQPLEKLLFERQTELNVQREQARSISEQIASLNRIMKRKEMLATEKMKRSDAKELQNVEVKKNISASKLMIHTKAMHQNEVTVRTQALRIQHLEDKLEVIGEAIRGDDHADAQRVDALVAQEVQAVVRRLRQLAANQSEQLMELDSAIEREENRVRFFTGNHTATQKEIQRETAKHHKQVHTITETAKQLETAAKEAIAHRRNKTGQSRSQSAAVVQEEPAAAANETSDGREKEPHEAKKTEMSPDEASVKIQSLFRTQSAKKDVVRRGEERDKAVEKRIRQEASEGDATVALSSDEAAVRIQSLCRARMARKEIRELREGRH